MKKIKHTVTTSEKHWVGDGFHVRSMFGYNNLGQIISPFLLMDYAEPVNFQPVGKIRGVGQHPHRGFETVTIVYDGEVEHRDSHGGGGKIGPGDVQWMTAASGLVHEEFHSKEFSKKGGPFEMIQLWVNLPAKDKMTKPRYQPITKDQIPVVENSTGMVRVIAGDYEGTKGPASTFTPINMWDIRLNSNISKTFSVPAGHTTVVFVINGEVEIDGQNFSKANLIVLENNGTDFEIKTLKDSKLMILTGEPINEPVVGYGPFVMNTPEEIEQAFVDFENGRMGQLV